MRIYNDRTDEYLDINSGVNGLTYNVGGTNYTVWHAGNDGSASGLDADTLDGVDSGSFLRSDANDSFSGTISGAGSINISGNITAATFTGDGSGITGVTASDADTLDGIDSTGFIRSTATASQNIYIRNTSPTLYFRDTDHNVAMLHTNSDLFYILRGADDSTSWTQVNSQWPAYWNLTNNNAQMGGSLSAVGEVTAYSSDRRLKENIVPIENALDKVKSLHGVNFDWKAEVNDLGFHPVTMKNDAGVIAQEVEAVLPQAIAKAPFDTEWDSEAKEYKSKSGENYITVKYEKLAPLFIEAIKEQDAKIEAQAAEIAELKEMVKKLLDK